MPIIVRSSAATAKNASSAMLNRRALAAFDTTCSIVRIFAAGRSASSAFNSLRTAEASASGIPFGVQDHGHSRPRATWAWGT